jgi:hypothetical protein
MNKISIFDVCFIAVLIGLLFFTNSLFRSINKPAITFETKVEVSGKEYTVAEIFSQMANTLIVICTKQPDLCSKTTY